MKLESGKNYITRNLDVRTLVDKNLSQSILSTLSQSILSTETKTYNNYRVFSDGSYRHQESPKDHLYKIDTDPKSSIDKYFISTLFQIMDYQEDLLIDTIANITDGYDQNFEILIDDAKENSVLLDYDDGYEKDIVIISCYNNNKIKILDKIKRLHKKVYK